MLYAAWRLLDLGAAVQVGDTSTFLRDLRRALKGCAPPRASLMDAPVERWEQDLLRACAARRGKVPDRWDRQRIRSQLHRIYFAVYSGLRHPAVVATRDLGRRERPPHPAARARTAHARPPLHRRPPAVAARRAAVLPRDADADRRAVDGQRPLLPDLDPQVRPLPARPRRPAPAPGRGSRGPARSGPRLARRGRFDAIRAHGRPLSKSTAYQYLNQPENLYGWLLDHRADLARAVGDDRWLALGIEHSRFYQPGERPRTSARAPDEEEVIEDAVMTPRPVGRRRAGPRRQRRRSGRPTGRADAAVARQDRPPRDGDPAARLRPTASPGRRRQRQRHRRLRRQAALPADQDRRRAGHDPGRPRDRRHHRSPATVGPRMAPRPRASTPNRSTSSCGHG